MAGSDGGAVHPAGSNEGSFSPADFEARYIEFARLLGFVCRSYEHFGGQRTGWAVMLDGEWYSAYGSEFRAAMEYIRYYGFEQAMREALDAIGAGEVQVPTYRNP